MMAKVTEIAVHIERVPPPGLHETYDKAQVHVLENRVDRLTNLMFNIPELVAMSNTVDTTHGNFSEPMYDKQLPVTFEPDMELTPSKPKISLHASVDPIQFDIFEDRVHAATQCTQTHHSEKGTQTQPYRAARKCRVNGKAVQTTTNEEEHNKVMPIPCSTNDSDKEVVNEYKEPEEAQSSPSPPQSDNEKSCDEHIDNNNDDGEFDFVAESNSKRIDDFTNKMERRMDELMGVIEAFETNFNSLSASRKTSEGRSNRGPKT